MKRAALTAIAMLPSETSRDFYAQYLHDKDDACARRPRKATRGCGIPADLPMLEKAWQDEGKTAAAAFAGLRPGDAGQDRDQPNSARCSF